MKMFGILLILLGVLCGSESGRILGVFHTSGRSHFALGEALLKSLAARGHQVTMISPFPQTVPIENYTDVYIDGIDTLLKKNQHVLYPFLKGHLEHGYELYTLNVKQAVHLFKNKNFKNFLKSDQKFDVVIIDCMANYFHLGLAHHYRASSIVISTVGINQMTRRFSNNPLAASYVPHITLPYSDKMNFFQRLHNTWQKFICYFLEDFVFIKHSEVLLKKYMPNSPPLEDLLNNVSMVLANSNIGVETPRPLMPNEKLIGGLHITEPKKLPEDIQQFLDGAQEGVILFSFGSNLRMSELPPEKLDVFVKVLSKIPQRILWKWDDYNKSKGFDNIMFRDWFPQNDILAHPNVKALITHGGLNTLIEASYRGVPMLAIPFFGDQFNNVGAVVRAGYALKINLQELTEDILFYNLHQIINNPKYTSKAKRHSILIKDQEMKPLDRAIYWVEYVLRNNGARELRTGVDKLSAWSYYLIDVAVFSFGIFIGFIFLCWYVVKKIRNFRRICKIKIH